MERKKSKFWFKHKNWRLYLSFLSLHIIHSFTQVWPADDIYYPDYFQPATQVKKICFFIKKKGRGETSLLSGGGGHEFESPVWTNLVCYWRWKDPYVRSFYGLDPVGIMSCMTCIAHSLSGTSLVGSLARWQMETILLSTQMQYQCYLGWGGGGLCW